MLSFLKNIFSCKNSATKNILPDEDIAPKIIDALGGSDNITKVESCLTRVRVQLKDAKSVDKRELKMLGAVDVVTVSNGHLQLIFGQKSEQYQQAINAYLSK